MVKFTKKYPFAGLTAPAPDAEDC